MDIDNTGQDPKESATCSLVSSNVKTEDATIQVNNNEKLLNFKKTLTKEGHVEEIGGVISYVAKDFMDKLKVGGELIFKKKGGVQISSLFLLQMTTHNMKAVELVLCISSLLKIHHQEKI